jgi:hypothetical protein
VVTPTVHCHDPGCLDPKWGPPFPGFSTGTGGGSSGGNGNGRGMPGRGRGGKGGVGPSPPGNPCPLPDLRGLGKPQIIEALEKYACCMKDKFGYADASDFRCVRDKIWNELIYPFWGSQPKDVCEFVLENFGNRLWCDGKPNAMCDDRAMLLYCLTLIRSDGFNGAICGVKGGHHRFFVYVGPDGTLCIQDAFGDPYGCSPRCGFKLDANGNLQPPPGLPSYKGEMGCVPNNCTFVGNEAERNCCNRCWPGRWKYTGVVSHSCECTPDPIAGGRP